MNNKFDLNILFEDDSIILLSKPAGVLTIQDRYDKTAPNLRKILKDKYDPIFVVHRLDKETSGIMIFAKDAESHKLLNDQFQEHTIERKYHVLISGYFSDDELDIDIPLKPDPVKKGKMVPSIRGKESLTKVKVIERFRASTLIECSLITGRHHQIRVHCSAIGHPLLVDDLYGNSSEFKLSSIKKRYKIKKDEIEKPVLSRVSMHAYSLKFLHPKSKQIVEFVCEYPKDFKATIELFQKYASIKY